ncbi:methyltransferase domain-containing protein [Paenibacillus woosongensis]|uniref:Methyltransferase domain-containing protein n=1 Tax=Paenibacillus woosongensis TaxID=307580 RepID=A0AA95I0F3_9BACL|nr:class I SAM-dependent methyltransferase [Paenibacillus woosongensis]WHX48224.1 methyltransferase domain-containing protein [Paenibacillus woosongensis]
MGSIHDWKPELYDQKLGFVSDYGKDVLRLLQPQPGEMILDLGCGTGDLSFEIQNSGARVLGMDYSPAMIEQGRRKYPSLDFIVGNAADFSLDQSMDAVFSNAALHWIKDAEAVAACVWRALRPGGRFVAEFGGRGNVDTIIQSTCKVLSEHYGIDGEQRNPWFFPSIGEYSSLLEAQGFRVTYAVHFDRPTPLEDGENGLFHWLSGLGADEFFQDLSDTNRARAFQQICNAARAKLYQDNVWFADYKRIRVVAFK